MNIYFDTKFTGLVPNTTLISIGCVSEAGHKFYAEFTDYDESLCDDWIKENVLGNCLLTTWEDRKAFFEKECYSEIDWSKAEETNVIQLANTVVAVYGDTETIARHFRKWLINVSGNARIQFVSDVCHYDFYLLCNQIFGGDLNMPYYINPVCYDICQSLWPDYADDNELSDLMKEAFDYSREDLCKQINGKLPDGDKHNALYYAKVIKLIYEGWFRK